MSTEAVKKRLLLSTSVLNIPLDRTPRETKVNDVCAAAKLLRKQLLREHTSVVEKIQKLRQRQLYNDETDDDGNEEIGNQGDESVFQEKHHFTGPTDLDVSTNLTYRHEFMFLADLQIAEKIVIPVLLAHGIKFVENLLPQLLKLLIALLLPVPRFSAQEAQQKDLLTRIKIRCGTDQFFALMVQIVADIATKRASGKACHNDFSLLSIVLTIISLVLDGHPRDITAVAGSFSRSQGVELLLVVVSQNYAKVKPPCAKSTTAAPLSPMSKVTYVDPHSVKIDDTISPDAVKELNSKLDHGSAGSSEIEPTAAQEVVVLNEDSMSEDNEGEEESENSEDFINKASSELVRQFEERVKDFFESDQQLWKWNVLVIKSLSSVLSCVSPMELAQLSTSGCLSSSPGRQLNPFHDSEQLKACKQENDKWHCIARGRNGAMSSNSILVRSDTKQTYTDVRHDGGGQGDGKQQIGSRAIGSVSTLLTTKRNGALEAMKDIDFRKRGRFVGGMSQGTAPLSDIPLPTKIQLSQQIRSFLCFGFEPLGVMTWARHEKVISGVDQSTKEFKEMMAAYRNSDEIAEMNSPLEASVYESFSIVLAYVKICTSFLGYIRETARIMKQDNIAFTSSPFQQQWQSVSSIITLGHLDGGFAMLRSFLQCKDLRQRLGMIEVVHYLAEMLLVLTLLLKGDLIQDAAVTVAAHALVSSILYKEANIKTVFDLMSVCAGNRKLSVAHAQTLSLFIHAVFQLMDHCSYKGHLLLMKRSTHYQHQHKNSDTIGLDHVSKSNSQHTQERMPQEAVTLTENEERRLENSLRDPALELRERENEEEWNSSHGKDSEELDTVGLDGNLLGAPNGTPLMGVDHTNGKSGGELTMDKAMACHTNDTCNDDRVGTAARASSYAASEAYSTSIASSSLTAPSDFTSEREVATSSYFHRLATPKNMHIMKVALQHWRINNADVNLALMYLMKRLMEEGCESVFYNVNFLLVVRDIIVNGKRSHRPLYDVCDELAYNFFNPKFAKIADERARTFFDMDELPMVSGAQSFLGFEVALRCARSLFYYSATDYRILEEKAMPNLMEHTVLELPEGPSHYGSIGGDSLERNFIEDKFENAIDNDAAPEAQEKTSMSKPNQAYIEEKGRAKTRKRQRQGYDRGRQSVENVEDSVPTRIRVEEAEEGMDDNNHEASDSATVVL